MAKQSRSKTESPKQAAANEGRRRKAYEKRFWEKSTGPRTPEGKARRKAACKKAFQKHPYSQADIAQMVEPFQVLLKEASVLWRLMQDELKNS